MFCDVSRNSQTFTLCLERSKTARLSYCIKYPPSIEKESCLYLVLLKRKKAEFILSSYFSAQAPHPSRAVLAAGSPSRFAPSGNQAHPPNVSISGTNYVVSSPSPAASGGTSVFRDARHPSPWN